MGSINVRPQGRTRGTQHRTHEGAPARRIGPIPELRRTVMACLLWEHTFYEDGQSVADRIAELCAEIELPVLSSIAREARDEHHLRHVPLLIAREMARRGGEPGSRIIGSTIAHVIQRADELTEFLAIYWKDGREPLSNQVKRGLAAAFCKFDAYQLAKYDRDGDVKLRDVMFLVHPKPLDETQEAVHTSLVDGTLEVPGTWENRLSAGGDKRTEFLELISERKLGDLALLRNLRGMLEAGITKQFLASELRQRTFRRTLPFRFITAARHAPELEDALEDAMLRALAEMPTLAGHTVLLVDHSSSMTQPLSGRSELSRFDAAAALAIMLRELCEDASIYTFSSPHSLNWFGVVPSRRGFALGDAMLDASAWGGTDIGSAKREADAKGPYDRMIVLTDEQSRTPVSNPAGEAAGYFINVATFERGIGYGEWVHIDGFSESIVKWLLQYESFTEEVVG